tara:strand:- start:143 stop:598 length:456 start_codon:yes stop_codon:yes gene_type:complete
MTKEFYIVCGNLHKTKPIIENDKLVGIQYLFRSGNKILPLQFQSKKQQGFFVKLCTRVDIVKLKGYINNKSGLFEVGVIRIGDKAEKQRSTEKLLAVRSENEQLEEQRNSNSIMSGCHRSGDYSMIKSEASIDRLKKLQNKTRYINKKFSK